MQQATVIRTPRRPSHPIRLIEAIVLLIALVALAGTWFATRQPSTLAPAGTSAVAPQLRRFADEAAYAPGAGEYVGLGESYLPISGAPAHPAVVAPQLRRFADEAAYAPGAGEYVGLGESYLPATTTRTPSSITRSGLR